MDINKVATDIKARLSSPFDLVVREFSVAGKKQAIALFIDSIANSSRISTEVINPLMRAGAADIKDIMSALSVSKAEMIEGIEDCVAQLLSGNTIVIIDGVQGFISASSTQFQGRGVIEPPTASVVKGPREGFTEDAMTNISLLRKRLKTPDLVLKDGVTGRYTGTKITVAYIKSIASKEVVSKVLERIKAIDIDGIIDSHYVAQFLQDRNLNIFQQVGNDEKPDIVAAKLLEGRVAVIVDGSPIVLTVPYILLEDIQNSDDYYTNNTVVSLKRVIRLIGGVIAIVLPGLYIAMQLYHYKIVPLNTLITITNSVGHSPFSPMVETIFVLILFEILYEASLRMPKHLGAATSLVGALVLGDTAVKAGLISSPAVLVAALSGITMYILPSLAPQISLLRFFFALIGGVLGLYGIILSMVLLVCYLAGLESFGAPMLAPFAPYNKADTKDAIFKKSLRDMRTRPKSIPNINAVRTKEADVQAQEGSGDGLRKQEQKQQGQRRRGK